MPPAHRSSPPRRRCPRRVLGTLAAVALLGLMSPVVAAQDPAARRARALEALVQDLAGAGTSARIDAVNRFFNRFERRSDTRLWGREDHWATPAEFLRRGAGDCEDFAIAKYFALRAMGVDARDLALLYVHDRHRRAPHMVLLVSHPGVGAVVLDDRHSRALPVSRRTDLVPVYGLDVHGAFVLRPGDSPFGNRQTLRQRHRHWEILLARRGGPGHLLTAY